jgi:hypothetical protein
VRMKEHVTMIDAGMIMDGGGRTLCGTRGR